MNKILHTFAICAYGDSPYLEQCIRSVTGQTVRSEVLLCTSTPSPYLGRLAERYGIPLRVRRGQPGIREDWQFAWQQASGELVTIAHQDDIYRKNYMEELMLAYGRYPDMAVFASDYMTIRMVDGRAVDDTFNPVWLVKKLLRIPLRARLLSGSRYLKLSALALGNSICCPTCTYSKPLIGDKLFDSDFTFALDWDNLCTLAARRGRFILSEKPLLAYRVHSQAATYASIHNQKREEEENAMFRKIWPAPVAALLMRIYKKAYGEYDQ